MAQYATENIRTVALVGHGAAGKTTLAEALLACAKAIPTPGSVERGTTATSIRWRNRCSTRCARRCCTSIPIPRVCT